ncbi:hypothetical protein A33Q_1241 [Indibacter alkaliphilus LW1]|uniref:DUF2911 domain-containing protein n=1 Tax=Indibacter alkaliphilus (strain CCUG 57479 / KCTC 22604 / LW1) TaxID=1189612 RepID=S2DHV4_INDAL|nr:DUF2911 domain-containing protein [Indibacter alkaliphilus]EOZ98587.1 hypothetical protein A33Q_1241 [Indibacter alkaliphilus LW1]
MKNYFKLSAFAFLIAAITFNNSAMAQDQERASPPRTASGTVAGSEITINYSSPAVNGRQIWGVLVPLGEVWRAGANEATTFETSKDIKVQGKELPAGKYSLFIIPNEGESTLIFNKDTGLWGTNNYDSSKDALRVGIVSGQTSTLEERLVYDVNHDGVEMRWEYGRAFFKID